ncbi:MAG: hypothetical protein H0U40_11210 [Chloroflexia bacterium]|nr:hypothetical protein [Chloroflexia bacterium]MDQ3513527.1 hypothetical protein [Chloroflexota bacterium]
MDGFSGLLDLLTDPTVAYLLVSLGAIGVFLELAVPGASIPGVAGSIALALGLIGLARLSVDWTGLLLMGLGIALLAADVFLPSLGLLTIGGLASFIAGSSRLFDGAPPGERVEPILTWTVAACLAVFFVVVGGAALSGLRRRPATGQGGLIGTAGVVRRALEPEGMVFLDGALWRARSAAGPLPAGTTVTVRAVDGLTLDVLPVAGPASDAPAQRAGSPATRSPSA